MDYIEILATTEKLVAEAKRDAVKKHGRFVDLNHAYGVIAEELDETQEELEMVWEYVESTLRNEMRVGADEKPLFVARKASKRLIAEAVQLAAMLDKLQDYIEETEEAEEVMPCSL